MSRAWENPPRSRAGSRSWKKVLEIAEIDGRQAGESEREFAERMAGLRADVERRNRRPSLTPPEDPDPHAESPGSAEAEEDLGEAWSAIGRARDKAGRLRSPEAAVRVGVILTRAAKAAGEVATLYGIAEEQPEAARHPPARRPAVEACLELVAAARDLTEAMVDELAEGSEEIHRAADQLRESVETAVTSNSWPPSKSSGGPS